MAKVTDKRPTAPGAVTVICDVSPPRGADAGPLEETQHLDVDFLCVAYSPGKSVRGDSAMTAHLLRERTGKDVVFNLVCRDMNRLAIQNHLLGASLLGLENLVVVRGDPLTDRERELLKEVGDFRPTELIEAVRSMNQGLDYRGLKLRSPTDLCIGAAIDLGRNLEGEARLTHRKVAAGAHFFITQALYDLDRADQFLGTYHRLYGSGLEPPVFYGLQVLDREGIALGEIPDALRRDLDQGRPGTDIAAEMFHRYVERGFTSIYLVPPILKGGRRDYAAAQRALEACRR